MRCIPVAEFGGVGSVFFSSILGGGNLPVRRNMQPAATARKARRLAGKTSAIRHRDPFNGSTNSADVEAATTRRPKASHRSETFNSKPFGETAVVRKVMIGSQDYRFKRFPRRRRMTP